MSLLEILYSDDALLVINKPAGLLALPDGYDPAKPHLRGLLEPEFGRLWIVHRLDKDTSGVIILARNAESHRGLNAQFSTHDVEKIYHTITVGVPSWEAMILDAPLRANVGRRKRTVFDHQQGKPAVTAFKVLRRFQQNALVEAKPKTGRTHQIRAHLYHLGFPVIADPLYGEIRTLAGINRLALHAQSLIIRHPMTQEVIQFTAEYPEDFDSFLKRIS
jgi:tRNA pseudouridine32 synthase/23S rRNA pseudouridine746 synthase